MAQKSAIVIGAGLAGLSAGCYAQMNGYRSHIFEHHAAPGGVAAAWRRGEYLIDGGIHFVMGHKPGSFLHQLYSELGIVGKTHFVDMASYGRFIDEASGRSLEVTGDLERLASDLKALVPGEHRTIEEVIAGARAMRGLDLSLMAMGQPPELTGPLGTLKEMWGMRRFFRYFTGKYARPMAEYVAPIGAPWLREFLANLFLPEVPAWFVLMLLALLADRQLGLLEGGCLDFVLPMEKRYRDLGGEVSYRATVEEVLVEDDRAVGVRLADGTVHRADIVISAADGHSTIFQMLGGRYVNQKIQDRYRDWPLIRPMAMASFGVAREFPQEPSTQAIVLKHPFALGEKAIAGLMVRIFNYSSHFAPPGKTVVQAVFETEWGYWNELHKDGQRYRAEKERVAAEILARLERHYPGISSQVEVSDVATPYTTWRYTRNWEGAYMGWLPTPQVLNTRMERTLPGLSNFYLAGQWAVPGGGVPGCLLSGRQAVELICRRGGKPFHATTS